jgi:TolA-binding protein
MKRKNRNTANITANPDRTRSWKDDHERNADDAALFENISYYMKGRFDLEDAENDPSIAGIDDNVKKMISDYHQKPGKNKDNEKFIRESFTEYIHDKEILQEIESINNEIASNHINEVSAEWVKEWDDKKSGVNQMDKKDEELRTFVTGSVDFEKNANQYTDNVKSNRISKTRIVTFISLSAAAVLGLFILIRTLLPSSDPEKIFKTYYNPYKVTSSITRGAAARESDSYSLAVENYRIGDYQSAATGLTNIIQSDSSQIPARFLMGLVNMATGDFKNAIRILGSSAIITGEYGKDASWYLGLAYLKTGEKEKAARCFGSLADSPGFYSERAGKILRRLK